MRFNHSLSVFNIKLTLIVIILLSMVYSCQHKPEVKPVVVKEEGLPPSELVYQPNSKTIEYQSGGDTSVAPTIKGTAPFSYIGITSVPEHLGAISILPSGKLVFDNALENGTYAISVTVSNSAGATTFNSVYNVTVTNTPILISDLQYGTNTLTLSEGASSSSVAPTFSGTAPVVFSLTTNNEAATNGKITIDNNGVISVSNNLAVGNYQVTVSAENNAGTAEFINVFTVVINPVLVTGLVYAPNAMTLVINNAGSSNAPTFTAGSTPITYSLSSSPTNANITIDPSTGIVSANTSLPIGTYTITVTATNAAGAANFSNAFTITIAATATAPSSLSYSPNSLTVNQGVAGNSVVPSVSGTTPITYALISVSPSNAAITINGSSGVISVSSSSAPGSYIVSVSATNSVSTVNFNSIYTVNVSAAVLPSNLTYSTNTLSVAQGETGNSVTPTISGTAPITYSMSSSPAAGFITINNSTGVISVGSGSSQGTYNITVTATNAAGSAPFTNIYTVTITASLVSFANDIRPIIIANCMGTGCHSAGMGGQTNYSDYTLSKNNILAGGANSILDRINRTQGSTGFMPKFDPKLSQTQLDLFAQWQIDGLQP